MKTYKYCFLCLVLLLSKGCLSYAQNDEVFDIQEDERLIEFTTDRFTLPNLHVTSDGKNIIFDVLGDIYQVPIEGGKAEVLLQDNNWKRAGKLSPDGKKLAYVSDETGDFQVWAYNMETKEKRVFPTKESIHYPLYGYWDSNNRLIIPDAKGILSYNENGNETVIRKTKEHERSIINAIPQQISVNQNGNKAYIKTQSYFIEYDLEKRENNIVDNFNFENFNFIDFHRFNNNGKGVVGYTERSDGANVLFYIDIESGEVKELMELENTTNSTLLRNSFDFLDDTNIVLDKGGEIVRLNLETGEFRSILIEVEVKKVVKKPLRREPQYITDSIITASVLRNPVTRLGLDTIYFGAFGKLHSYSKNTGVIKEMYPEIDRFEVSPSLSPDGKLLAYATWDDAEMGHIYARVISTGKEYRLTEMAGRYINPIWSKDNESLLFQSDELISKQGYYGLPPLSGHTMSLNQINLLKNGVKVKSIKKITNFNVASPNPNRYYSSITFDNSDEGVFFITVNTKKGLSHPPELIHFDLNKKDTIQTFLLPNNIDEVSISPDKKHIAFIHSNQIFLDRFPFKPKFHFSENSDLIPEKYHTFGGHIQSVDLPESAELIYKVAPSYLYWQDEHTLMWGSAEEVYIYDLRTEQTEKIAVIKVQKHRAVPKKQYALTNVRIITMNKQDEVIEKGTILIKDNRIEAVGRMMDIVIPENYKVFELEGKTIMPGLIDVHAHYTLHLNEIQLQEYYQLLSNLAYGVTTIYEPSVNTLDSRDLSQMIELGKILGPRIFSSGNIIMEKPGQYDYKQIHSLKDAEREILSLKKLGVHGPIKEYSINNRQTRKWLRFAAEKYNMTITADQVKTIPAITRIIDGYTSFEHIYSRFTLLHEDFLIPLYDSDFHYTPTLTTESPHYLIYKDPKWNSTFCDDRTLFDGVNKLTTKSSFTRRCDDYLKYSFYDRNGRNEIYLRKQINILKNLIKNKAKISVGAHGDRKAGINTHWEMWLFTFTGLNNYEALKAATINGAEKLDLQEEIGSIEREKLADLVILNENPLEHIYNTAKINYTIINGRMYLIE